MGLDGIRWGHMGLTSIRLDLMVLDPMGLDGIGLNQILWERIGCDLMGSDEIRWTKLINYVWMRSDGNR